MEDTAMIEEFFGKTEDEQATIIADYNAMWDQWHKLAEEENDLPFDE